jgi:hypothetical protein
MVRYSAFENKHGLQRRCVLCRDQIRSSLTDSKENKRGRNQKTGVAHDGWPTDCNYNTDLSRVEPTSDHNGLTTCMVMTSLANYLKECREATVVKKTGPSVRITS